MLHLRQVDAGAQAQPGVQLAHGLGVALGQVIVDGHDVHALARQRVQIGRQGRGQGLALAGAHFGDFAVVQNHAADQLHVEVAHLEHALGRFAADRERFRQQRVQRFAVGDALLESGRLRLQLGIRQFFHRGLERIDLAYRFLVLLEQSLVAAAENLGQ